MRFVVLHLGLGVYFYKYELSTCRKLSYLFNSFFLNLLSFKQQIVNHNKSLIW